MEARQKVRGIATDDGMAKVTLLDLADRPGMAADVFAPLADAGIPVDSIIQNVGHDARDRPVVHRRSDTDLPAAEARAAGAAARAARAAIWPLSSALAKVSIVGSGIHNAPGLPGADVLRRSVPRASTSR